MSAASQTIKAAPDLRPFAAFIGGLILAGAIAAGLGVQAAAPATTSVLNTAPNADHGWSMEARPLPGTAGHSSVNRALRFYQPSGLAPSVYGEAGGSGFSRAGNVEQ